MNIILQNDLDNGKFFDSLIDDPELSDEQRQVLIQAKVDSEMQTIPKLEAMAYYINHEESDIDFIKNRIKELQQKVKAKENSISWIRNSIKTYMEIKNISQIDGETYKFKLGKPIPSVEIVSPDLIPDKYKRTTITTDYPKIAIKEAIESGEEIEGAILIYNKRLTIK